MLKRTSYHPIFNEVLDFSTALLDGEGRLIASSMGVTVHLGALELSAKAIIARFGRENFHQGDVLIHNNPFPGGTHLPDVDVVTPVYHRGELVAYSVARGHHGDIGGMHPGSFAGDTVSIFQEGVRLPPIKLYDRAVLNEGVERSLPRQRPRTPVLLGRSSGAGGRLSTGRKADRGTVRQVRRRGVMKATIEWAWTTPRS